MKSGAKSGSGFRTRFWGPLVLAHFPQAPKTVPFPGPNFGRRGTATPHFGARFWSRKIWARIKNQCQMQSDNPDVASSSICSTAAKKQVQACCMYTLILTRSATVEAPCARPHFLKGFSGSLMNPLNRQKLRITPSRRLQQKLHCAPTIVYCGCEHNDRFLGSLVRALFQALLGALSAKGGKRAGYSRVERDTAGFPSKYVVCFERIPRHGY